MSKKRTLLEEALDDAKSIKEAAIASAKQSLIKEFTPHLTKMFASKIEEMEREEAIDENEEITEVAEELEEEFNIDEILAELSDDEPLNEEKEEDEDKDDDKKSDKSKESDDDKAEKKDDKEEKPKKSEKSEKESEDDDDFSLEDVSEDELETLIKDVISQMVQDGELEPNSVDAGIGTNSMDANDVVDDIEVPVVDDMADGDIGVGVGDEEEEFSIDSLLEGLDEEEQINEFDTNFADVAQQWGMSVDSVKVIIAAAGVIGIPTAVATMVLAKEGLTKLFDKMKAKVGGSNSEETNAEMSEQVEELKENLRETKLLNSKLYFTVELFRNKKTLSEDQKIEVLKAFDKAETIKEAKLVYETLNTKISASDSSKSITRNMGRASKPIGLTERKQKPSSNDNLIINEETQRRFDRIIFGNND